MAQRGGEMIERFQGETGRRLLVDALLRQTVIQGSRDVAEQIAGVGELKPFAAGTRLIEQDGIDNDLYLIISGEVTITVNDRFVAERKQGQHVGEMALIDPVGRRVATVAAKS